MHQLEKSPRVRDSIWLLLADLIRFIFIEFFSASLRGRKMADVIGHQATLSNLLAGSECFFHATGDETIFGSSGHDPQVAYSSRCFADIQSQRRWSRT